MLIHKLLVLKNLCLFTSKKACVTVSEHSNIRNWSREIQQSEAIGSEVAGSKKVRRNATGCEQKDPTGGSSTVRSGAVGVQD